MFVTFQASGLWPLIKGTSQNMHGLLKSSLWVTITYFIWEEFKWLQMHVLKLRVTIRIFIK